MVSIKDIILSKLSEYEVKEQTKGNVKYYYITIDNSRCTFKILTEIYNITVKNLDPINYKVKEEGIIILIEDDCVIHIIWKE